MTHIILIKFEDEENAQRASGLVFTLDENPVVQGEYVLIQSDLLGTPARYEYQGKVGRRIVDEGWTWDEFEFTYTSPGK